MRSVVFLLVVAFGAPSMTTAGPLEETNKALARRFYDEVWFSRNMAAVDELVAPEYVVHDIGNRKTITEGRDEQQEVAEFFWRHGVMTGRIDFQIAEGDLVATRWQWDFQPRTWWMRLLSLGAVNPIPVVNVFRFQDGRIVEIWNHRHDIDTMRANALRIQGFAAGLISTLLVIVSLRRWRKSPRR